MNSPNSFFTKLTARIEACDSLLCVGLDPHPAMLAEKSAQGLVNFCLPLIEACAPLACAFKPNSAFFEAFGAQGFEALKTVIQAIPDEIPVILDAKRGDIASTAEAYARSVFELLGADAVTLSAYLGRDSLEPFLCYPGRGVFLLCKTSNPGSDDLQTLPVHGEALFLHLARRAVAWNQDDNLGLVVGATDPAAIAEVRQVAPELWILAPGIGPQGGDLQATLQAGLRPDGMGLIVSASRAIAGAGDPRAVASELRQAINAVRQAPVMDSSAALSPQLAALADSLLANGYVRFGEFTLKSGLQSPIYFDLRLLAENPGLMARVAGAYLKLLAGLSFDRLAALPYAGLPIGTAISLQGNLPLIYPRKQVKDYGTRAAVEGRYKAGETVVVIDDLATTGGSKFEALAQLEAQGLRVEDVVVLVDRQSGAQEALEKAGYRFHAVLTLTQMLDHWQQQAAVPGDRLAATRAFLAQDSQLS